MRFQLPQFIETETKLVGPLTLKQFLWVAGGAAILFLLFMTTGLSVWFFVIGLPVTAVFLAFAFVKINGIPMINYVAYLLSYTLNPKRYIFKKSQEDESLKFKNQNAK